MPPRVLASGPKPCGGNNVKFFVPLSYTVSCYTSHLFPVLSRITVLSGLNIATYLSSCSAVMSVHDGSRAVSFRAGISKLFWEPSSKLDITTTAWPCPALLCGRTAERAITITALKVSLPTRGGHRMRNTGCRNGMKVCGLSACCAKQNETFKSSFEHR